MNEEANAIKKVIDEINDQNNQIRDPLRKKQELAQKHRTSLREFEKHKEGLKNLKSKKITMKDKYIKIQKNFEELDDKIKVADEKKNNL